MLPPEAIQLFAQFGTSGLLLLVLNAIWSELKSANQFTRDLLLKMQAQEDEREKLRKEIEQLRQLSKPG